MRPVSFALIILGLLAGNRVLANSFYDAYDLEARDLDMYNFDSRGFQDVYLDDRELSYEDAMVREYEDPGLWVRDGLFDDELSDFVARELYDEYDLYGRDYYNDLAERQFEPDLAEREDGFEYQLEAREPLRYRIGIVIPNAHNN